MKVNKDSVLGDVLKKKGAKEVLEKFNFPCLGCPMAQMELGFLKIGDVCNKYGLDLKKILKELNKTKK